MDQITQKTSFSNLKITTDLVEELGIELQKLDLPAEKFKNINRAIDLVLKIHNDQTRDGLSYCNHLFRATLTLIKEFGIEDPNAITATLLHDSIDDQIDKLIKVTNDYESDKKLALTYISENYGEEVARIVEKLCSGDLVRKALKVQAEGGQSNFENELIDLYTSYIKEIVRNPVTMAVKLADFYDNARSLDKNNTNINFEYLKAKYKNAFKVFYIAVSEVPDGAILAECKDRILLELESNYKRIYASTLSADSKEVSISNTAEKQFKALLLDFYKKGEWNNLIGAYEKHSTTIDDRIVQELYIVALNKTKQYEKSLGKVQDLIAKYYPDTLKPVKLSKIDPLSTEIRGNDRINGELFSLAGKALREIGSLPATEQSVAILREMAGINKKAVLSPGEFSRIALELSTRLYETGYFSDRSYYAAINAAHNNMRLGNIARAERFAWMAQASMKDGEHGNREYWLSATRLEAALLTRSKSELSVLFEEVASLAEHPWMAETTAKTIEDTFTLLRAGINSQAESVEVDKIVTSALRNIQADSTLSKNHTWISKISLEIQENSTVHNSSESEIEILPSKYRDISEKIFQSTINREWRQFTTDLDELYVQADLAANELYQLVEETTSKFVALPIFPPSLPNNSKGLKGIDRANQRVADFAGDASQLTDIARASLAFDSLDQLYSALDFIYNTASIVFIKEVASTTKSTT